MGESQIRYNIRGLAEELEIDMIMVVKLFKNYFNEMKKEKQSVKEYLVNKDWEMLGRVVHNIKGVSANLEVYDVLDEATELDLELKSKNIDHAKERVNRLIELLDQAEIDIREYFVTLGLIM